MSTKASTQKQATPAPTVIKPTIGRKVWYRPDQLNDVQMRLITPSDQPCDATVIFVFDDRCVNLDVIDHHGEHHPVLEVQLLQEGDERPDGGGYAEWMPYQQGQAKAQA